MHVKKFLYNFNELQDTIESIIYGVEQETQLDEEQQYRIRLVMSELVMNIFKYSEADTVSINAGYANHQLKIEFRDNGKGFESAPAMQRDVRSSDLLMCESGRGIFLVRSIADSLQYTKHGNGVVVTLRLG
ncbi:MAG: ATP-binding protein [Christensenella sp.]|nr:ATP-binding protein [Christensenella sp.]